MDKEYRALQRIKRNKDLAARYVSEGKRGLFDSTCRTIRADSRNLLKQKQKQYLILLKDPSQAEETGVTYEKLKEELLKQMGALRTVNKDYSRGSDFYESQIDQATKISDQIKWNKEFNDKLNGLIPEEKRTGIDRLIELAELHVGYGNVDRFRQVSKIIVMRARERVKSLEFAVQNVQKKGKFIDSKLEETFERMKDMVINYTPGSNFYAGEMEEAERMYEQYYWRYPKRKSKQSGEGSSFKDDEENPPLLGPGDSTHNED